MANIENIIQGLSRSGAVSGFAGGLAGSALVGALSGKRGKKMAKSALQVGALAAVGGLAYTAYRRYQQGSPSPNPDSPSRATSQHSAVGDARWNNLNREQFEAAIGPEATSPGGLLLVRAMIAAAAADGHMDGGEQERIFRETGRMQLSADEKARLFDELRKPLTISELVAQVDNPETAVEVYAASLVAIDESRPEATTYLRSLASALQLPEELVTSIHTQAQLARQDEAA